MKKRKKPPPDIFNIARMQAVLEKPTIHVPIGLSREAKRAFIISQSEKKNK